MSAPPKPKPWKKDHPPKRILVIRLQAMGDMMITLPYVQALRDSLPAATQIDLLTRKEVDPIPRNLFLFDNVYALKGGRSIKKIFLHAMAFIPVLLLRRYDVVIDLQNNVITETVTKVLRPAAGSSFDRFSPIAAGERTRLTIEAAGFRIPGPATHFRLRDRPRGAAILSEAGWNGTDKLVVLNPAGAFTTRNWPLSYYASFAQRWLERYPDSRFVMLGTDFIADHSAVLKKRLGDRLIDLVGRTTPLEAFLVLQQVSFVLSEDSGLMHMAWISGIPTLVLFGSTRSDWSRPLGEHSFFLDSSDLACGNCMQELCSYGDTRCLTRYTPDQVFTHAMHLVDKLSCRIIA